MSRKKNNKQIDLKKNDEVIVSTEMEQVPAVLDMKATENELEIVSQELQIARMELEKTRLEIENAKMAAKLSPAREISQEEKQISEKHVSMSNEKLAKVKALEDQHAFDKVLVTGKFLNRRNPGKATKLPYIKYPEDPVKWYTLEDGKVYTIPRGFADQINEYYHVPRFIKNDGPMDPNQPESQIADIDRSNKTFSFVPVNF